MKEYFKVMVKNEYNLRAADVLMTLFCRSHNGVKKEFRGNNSWFVAEIGIRQYSELESILIKKKAVYEIIED